MRKTQSFGLSTVGGGRWIQGRVIAASTTMLMSDEVLLVNATGGAVTVTLLPLAQVGEGFLLGVVKTDASANAVTIDGSGAETIIGAATLATTTRWTSYTLYASVALSTWVVL